MAERIELAELNIRFTGDTSDMASDVTKAQAIVNASFRKIEQSADKVADSTDRVDDSFDDLDTGAVNLSARMNILTQAYDQLRGVVQQGIAIAQLGAQAERVEDRFRKFAATIGDSEELLVAFAKGSGGAVDKMTAMNTAALLIQQGLVTNNSEMEKTVELATRLGDQTLSATSRLEFFGQLLKNQSIRLLDNFGISSGRVRTRILELQKATEGLTREEAFRIAVFEEGQVALDVLGERVDDNALKFEKATAKLADMRVEMGRKIVPIVAKAVELFTELDNITIMLVTTLTGALGIITKFSGGLTPLIARLGLTTGAFISLTAVVGLAILAFDRYRNLQKQVAEGQEKVTDTINAWSDQVSVAVAEGSDLGDEIEKLADNVNKADAALHRNGNLIQDMATAYVRGRTEGKLMRDSASQVRDIIIKQADSFEDANRLVGIYNERVGNSRAKLDDFTIAQWDNIAAMDAWLQRVDNAGIAIDHIASVSLEDWKRQQEDARIATEKAAQAAEDYAENFDSLGDSLRMAALRQARMTEQAERAREVQQKLVDMQRERIKLQEELAEATRKAAEEEAEALREVIEAHEEALNAQLRRSEQLKDADAERIARIAIGDLEKAQQAGLITFEEYAQAVTEIQDRFGLADDESRALTLGLANLVSSFTDGTLEATQFDEALSLLIEDAKDGVVAFDDLIDRANSFNDVINEGFRIRNMAGGDGDGGQIFSPLGFLREDLGGGDGLVGNAGRQGVPITTEDGAPSVVIYGGLNIEGVDDAEEFLRQLLALMS